MVVQLAFLGMAFAFWIAAKASLDPVMPAEVYGEWVVSFPAENWAASIMVASTVYLLGIMINGEWRGSPFLRLVGACWHIVTLTSFCIGSFGAKYGDFFALGTGVFALVHIWFAVLNLGDLARAVIVRGSPSDRA